MLVGGNFPDQLVDELTLDEALRLDGCQTIGVRVWGCPLLLRVPQRPEQSEEGCQALAPVGGAPLVGCDLSRRQCVGVGAPLTQGAEVQGSCDGDGQVVIHVLRSSRGFELGDVHFLRDEAVQIGACDKPTLADLRGFQPTVADIPADLDAANAENICGLV